MSRPRLHILGCGRTARTLARCMFEAGAIEVGQVVNRDERSARAATDFVGAGSPANEFSGVSAEDWLMIGLPDGEIEPVAGALARDGWRPHLAFHLSGSVPASVLESLTARCAAVHPLRAFSSPQHACENFPGTWCVAEGDDAAVAALAAVFAAAGARWLAFSPNDKAAWHAATVAASNFLVTINALARDLAEGSGMAPDDARRLMADLQSGTLARLAVDAPEAVLTGPIERGDEAACRRILRAVARTARPEAVRQFSDLALATLALARSKRGARDSDAALEKLFSATSRGD